MAKYIITLFFITAVMAAAAQDSIRSRVILIGDAGEQSGQQGAVITNAAEHIIPGKTSVIYLGDNVYPNGMALPPSADTVRTQQILRSQFAPMRSKGAPVYFVPGNHDWDRMGKLGLAKIKEQWAFLDAQHDPLLKLLPANGCPDPEEINVGDSMVIIAFDSEWWLFPYNKNNPDATCSCNNTKDVLEKMGELFYKNRYKVILLADHHPFQSYGHHGGYYSLKDHIFPLTAANDNLYIPLPIIGSLYPLLRSTFTNPEDLVDPLYKSMIKQVDGVFSGFPNLVHVAGHEHGLQLIKDGQLQVVSGAGAKNDFVKKGKHTLFVAKEGYVTVDLLVNNSLRLTYYVANDTGVTAAFAYVKPYTAIKKIEDSLRAPVLPDSVQVQVHPAFDSVSNLHRTFFGENYRKEWATATTLPVIKISIIKGGLTPYERGGGQQSVSLRLKDKNGKEWVLRSVNKNPEKVLPEQLRETFAKDVFVDAMSAQHPFSALIVPVIANAAGVPHANPLIGFIAPDTALGIYEKDFANTVCLLEEREPVGKSDNSEKMQKELLQDNDNSFDSTMFLKARLLDLFIGDWDRHEDQWRWAYNKEDKNKKYIAVPRDRDQVFHLMEGVLPRIASKPWLAPWLHDFNGDIKRVDEFFTESNQLNRQFLNQFSHDEWMKITSDFVAAMTDSVLETALLRLPAASYNLKHDELLRRWKERRTNLPAAMDKYYRFLNKIVDIQTTDKNELVTFTDAPNKGLQVTINKINKNGKVTDLLYSRVFDAGETKEIRLFVYKGNDSIVLNNASPIKLRIVGKKGDKVYNVIESAKKVEVYGKEEGITFRGNDNKLVKYLSNDSLNTVYMPTNPYNKVIPLLNGGYNVDDGLMLGFSVKFINQGFRKKPFGSTQTISFLHSFSTTAFSSRFRGEWLNTFGKADFLADVKILAPDNTQNFFGLGNSTRFVKTGDYAHYYRTTFAVVQAEPSIRWRMGKGSSSFSIGPSVQFYRYDADENDSRFIQNTSLIHSYDSATINKDKAFAGATANLIVDSRNDKLLPTNGAYIHVKMLYYGGINNYSKSFMQVIPEIAFYKSLDKQSAVVIADRLGGGVTAGKAAFYQSLFLGGQENLLGYRQYRFAGQYMLYNNLEARLRIAQVGSYILPGQLGLVAFYDAGKVWADGYNSSTVHQGVGGALYFAPAQMAVLQFVAGYSQEGWYPYFTFGFRF